jgi:hypothetical protein
VTAAPAAILLPWSAGFHSLRSSSRRSLAVLPAARPVPTAT